MSLANAVDAARVAYTYLAETDRPAVDRRPADAVMGFGMFDLTLPVFCGDLYQAGEAARIIFTGGIGAGTGNLSGPEAVIWRETLRQSHPSIPEDVVVIEAASTNTGENVAFTAALLAARHPDLAFGTGLTRVIVVASPTRLRRVWLTLRCQQPTMAIERRLPGEMSFERDSAAYEAQGLDYVAHITGELDRIVAYPARGWIVAEPLPPDVASAHEMLRTALMARGSRS